jgi:hypothetical protein
MGHMDFALDRNLLKDTNCNGSMFVHKVLKSSPLPKWLEYNFFIRDKIIDGKYLLRL